MRAISGRLLRATIRTGPRTGGSENDIDTNVLTAPGATISTTDKAGEGWDIAISYRDGPLAGSLTTWDVNNSSYVTVGETGLAHRKARNWQSTMTSNSSRCMPAT